MGSGSPVIASAAIGSVEGLMKLENVVSLGSTVAKEEIKSQYKKKRHYCQQCQQQRQSKRIRQSQHENLQYDPD